MRGAFCLALATLLLAGCAERSFTMRTLPAQTPAADVAAQIRTGTAITIAPGSGNVGLVQQPRAEAAPQPKSARDAAAAPAHRADRANPSTASSNTPSAALSIGLQGPAHMPPETPPPLSSAAVPSMYSYDPWEKLNRFTYRFNARFDDHVFLPVANGYRRVLPSPVRVGIHNFFSNLAEIQSIVNYAVQLRWINGGRNIGRFVINSTIGIGGLLDIATKLHLPAAQTGLSATLATYGVHPGPYLVIPLLGPSTLRDGVGFLGDYGVNYSIDPANLYRGTQSYALSTVDAVDQRSNISFQYFGTGSPFEYETVRFLYVHRELIEDATLRRWQRPGSGAH